jgi:DNA-binding transcriptional ArsR family regulator
MSLQVNPAADEAVKRHHQWLRQTGLAEAEDQAVPLTELDAGRITAYAYPRADLDTLCLATDWTGWYLHFDNYFDESSLGATAALARATVDLLQGRPRDHSRSIVPQEYEKSLSLTRAAFGDLTKRTREVMAPVQYRIFTAHLAAYFDALVVEATNREQCVVLDLNDYCALRRDTGPCLPLVDLIEQAESVRLPKSFYLSPVFERLSNVTADIASWINDVFSASKEHERGDSHNLVLVFQHGADISLADATRCAVDYISEHLLVFDSAEVELAAQRDAGILAPAEHEVIGRWIRGLRDFLNHGDWYLKNPRYDPSREIR